MNNFIQRTMSSVVFVLVVALAVFVHPMVFTVVFGVFCGWATLEFHKIVGSGRVEKGVSFALSTILFVSMRFIESEHFSLIIGLYGAMLLCGLAAVIWVRPMQFLSYEGGILISQVWIALPFSLLHYMNESSTFPPYFVMAFFIVIWCNDVGGYCVGSVTSKLRGGNHKMCVAVSPNKSWEGFIGGLLMALCGGYICSLFFCSYPVLKWLILSVIIVFCGVLGDLSESCLKRTVGIKDSGFFLPGHGGVLDRFDSLLFAAPAVVICMRWLS